MKIASVEEQYRKYPELNKCEVGKFVEWTKQQKHLPAATEFIGCAFLYACQYSLELAKQTYDLFCTTKTVIPEFFGNRDTMDKGLVEMMETIAIYKVPKITEKGHLVFFCKLINPDPSKFHFANCIKLYGMCLELIQLEEGIAKGIIMIFDTKGLSLGHLTRLSLTQVKQFLFMLQETLPIRLAEIHFINCIPIVDKLLALLRPFTRNDLMDQMQMHTKLETFHKCFEKELIPIEYGGTVYSMDKEYKQLYDNIRANRDYFLEEERTGRNKEELREGKPKNVSDIFGIEGNFKKLDID